MPVRKASAVWNGSLKEGRGTMRLESGAFEGNYSFQSRFEEGVGTNPEELIGAAHAGCFSMALSSELGKAGFNAQRVETEAQVTLEKVGEGFKITKIHLTTQASVPEVDQDTFMEKAEAAKKGCPVAQLVTGAEISLDARLIQ